MLTYKLTGKLLLKVDALEMLNVTHATEIYECNIFHILKKKKNRCAREREKKLPNTRKLEDAVT